MPARTARPANAGRGPLLANYGETGPSTRNIPLGNVGTVKVHGRGVPPEHTVWFAGAPVPVDESGNFVAEAVLPKGMHTVEVAVLDPAGQRPALPARSRDEARRLVLRGHRRPHARGRPGRQERAERARGRRRALRPQLALRRPARVLHDRQVLGELEAHRERRHARGADRGPVRRLREQDARVAVPAHRSRLSLPDVRRRRHGRRDRSDQRQVLRQGRPAREPRDVGQLQGRLPRQRARPGRPRPLRRQRPLPDARHHAPRRAAPLARRLRRRAGHGAEPRGVPRHRGLAVLPAPPGHPARAPSGCGSRCATRTRSS